MIDDVQYMNDVQPLMSVQPMQDVVGLQNVTPLTFQSPKKYVAPLRVKNFSPEISNSLLDVLLSPRGNENLLRKYGLSSKYNVPPLVLLLHLYDSYINPLVRHGLTSGQGWKEVGLNTLQEVGEDLDVFSNIIKSQFEAAGGKPGLKSLGGALGFTDGYRKVYNFNTGNTAADIAMEFISDPINWFTLGGKSVAQGATETAAKEISETLTKELVSTVTKEVLEETAEQVGKEAVKKLSTNALKELSRKITKLVFEYGDDITYDVLVKYLTRETVEELLETNLKELTPKLIKQLIDSRAYRWFKGATAIKQGAEIVDKTLASIAWSVTPVGLPAKYIVKPFAKMIFNHIYNYVVDHLKEYNLLPHFIKKKEAYQDALKTSVIQNNALNETIFKNSKELLGQVGLNETKLQYIIYDILKDAQKTGNDINLYTAIMQYISDKYNVVWQITKENADAYQELIDAAVIAPSTILQLENELEEVHHLASIKGFKKYLNKHKDLEEIFKFIDEKVLKINDVQYGLSNLQGFLNELFLTRGVSDKYKMQLAELLETLGVRLDNAIEISDVLNSAVENKTEELQKIIEKSKGTYLLTQKDYEHIYTKINKEIKASTGTAINKAFVNKVAAYNSPKYESLINESFKTIEEAVNDMSSKDLFYFKLGDNTFQGVPIFYRSIKDSDVSVYLNNKIIVINPDRIKELWNSDLKELNKFYPRFKNNPFKDVNDFTRFLIYREFARSYIDISGINLDQYTNLIESVRKSLKLPSIDDVDANTIINIVADDEAFRLYDIANHPIDYVRNIIRNKDLSDSGTITALIDRLNANIEDTVLKTDLNKYMKNIKTTLEQTDYIINNSSKSLDTVFNIKEWYANLEQTIKDLDIVLEDLNKAGAYGVEAHTRLLEIQIALKSFTEDKFLDSVTNYADNLDGLVAAQLSHLGMFDVLVQNTHLCEDPSIKTFLAQLSDKTSMLHHNYNTLIKAFENADMPEVASDLNKVFAQIQTVNNLNELLTTNLKTSVYLKKQTQRDILRVLFDSIENHKTYLISDILTDELQDPNQWVLAPLKYSQVNPETLEPIVKQKTLRQTLLDETISRLKQTEVIQNRIKEDVAKAFCQWNPTIVVDGKRRRISIDVLWDYLSFNPNAAKAFNKLYDNTMNEIETQIKNLLNNYINEQSKLMDRVTNIALSTLYDTNTINTLNLGTKLKYDLFRNTPNPTVELLSIYDSFTREFNKFADSIQLGIDEIKYFDNKLKVPLHRTEAIRLLQQINQKYNLYSASIESGLFTTKYLQQNGYWNNNYYTKGFKDIFKLDQNLINGTTDEYIMLVDKLWNYRDVLHEQFKYEDSYIKRIRKALIDTYSAPNALFAPKDPLIYFNSLDKQEILTWETITKGNLSLQNKTRFYDAYKKYTQELQIERYTTSDIISTIESKTRNKGFIDDYDIAEMATISRRANIIEYANRAIDANLRQTLHSLDSLGKYSADISKYIQDDIKAIHDIIDTIHDIENDSTLRTYYSDFGNTDDLQKLGGVYYGYEESIRRAQQTMYADIKATMAMSIAQATPEEIAGHIYFFTPGGLVFHNSHIVKTEHIDGSVSYEPIKNIFNFSKEELKKAGLMMQKVTDENGDWYQFHLIDHRKHTKLPKYLALPATNQRLHERYASLINKYRLYLNIYEDKEIPDNLITVEALNKDTWDMYMEKYKDFFGDVEEQKLYQKFTPQGNSSFFDKSYSRLNLAVIGGYDTYNIWNKINPTYIPRSTLLSQNTLTGLTAAVNRSNKINKYLTLFFNEDWALDNPLLTKMFEGANDKRIKQFFAESKYKVAVLRSDKKGLPRIWEYNVSNRHTLDKAIAAGGILVPIDTFGAMRQVINDRKMTNSLLDIYRRVVPSTYKSMYLYTLGFPFRNFIDSMLYKNMNELGGIVEAPETIQYEIKASKALELHNKLQEEMLAETGGETLNKQIILDVLGKHTQEEAEVYYLVDIFRKSNASGGFSDSLGSWLEAYNKSHTDDIRPLWEKIYEDDFLFAHTETYPWTPQIKAHPYNPLAHLRELNSHIEDTARFALFLASIDAGIPVNDAIARVVKTHFDYSTGGDLMDICERIFWFSTFPINNFNYYVEGGLTKSPSLLRLAMDTQTASWNNGEYTYEELKKTNFLAYHALTGNIRIGNWIIKTSPSLFDFIGLMTDPLGNIKDRLNPFISIATGNTDDVLEDLNPLQTQFRLFPKQFQGNPIPSILSQINDYTWYRTLGKWRTTKKKTSTPKWTKYPKINKPIATKNYVRKYYSRRYYTRVRKLTRTSLYEDLPRYYRIGRKKGKNAKLGLGYRDL